MQIDDTARSCTTHLCIHFTNLDPCALGQGQQTVLRLTLHAIQLNVTSGPPRAMKVADTLVYSTSALAPAIQH